MRSLIELIERLREKMQAFRNELKRSEALTRYVLVDPMLKELGWDLDDPMKVRPEFVTETGKPDYALIWEGSPRIMIEVKPLESDLEKARSKGFEYCWQNKVPYYVITDGRIWKAYNVEELGGREVFSADLLRDTLGEAARKLLALWYPTMPKVEVAPEQIVKPPQPPSPPKIALKELHEKLKRGEKFPKPPTAIYLPDGRREIVKIWKDIFIAVARYCLPHLKGKVPIKPRYGERILIGRSSSGMRTPRRINNLWLETNFSVKDLIRYSCYLLELAEMSAENVYLEL